jgi:hypothetical protein
MPFSYSGNWHARVLFLDSGRNRTQYPQKVSDWRTKTFRSIHIHVMPGWVHLKALPRLSSNIMIDTRALNTWRSTGIVVSVENDKGPSIG